MERKTLKFRKDLVDMILASEKTPRGVFSTIKTFEKETSVNSSYGKHLNHLPSHVLLM